MTLCSCYAGSLVHQLEVEQCLQVIAELYLQEGKQCSDVQCSHWQAMVSDTEYCDLLALLCEGRLHVPHAQKTGAAAADATAGGDDESWQVYTMSSIPAAAVTIRVCCAGFRVAAPLLLCMSAATAALTALRGCYCIPLCHTACLLGNATSCMLP